MDSDGDGMPDDYEAQFPFLNPLDPNDAGLDHDGDGLSNLAEYLAGTNPGDPVSSLRITRIEAEQGSGILIAWQSAPNRFYTIQRTPDLSVGFTNLAEHIAATPPENVYWDTGATNAAQFFYRIKLDGVSESVTMRPLLAAPRSLNGGEFEFSLYGEDGVLYRIERSTNLLTWQPLTNVICTDGMATVRDATVAGSTQRFYRAVLVP
jgi:hypothetical protein